MEGRESSSGGGGAAPLHLLKICVGAASVADLERWQAERRAESGAGPAVHVTRQWPRRAEALLAGGSLYWVIRGLVLCRQRIVGLEPLRGADGINRTAILLDPAIRRTEPQPRKPFQGWRYLAGTDAPADLPADAQAVEALPGRLRAELMTLGVL